MRKGYVLITDETRTSIKNEIKRTGYGPQRALKGNVQARQIGLTSGIIYGVIGQNGIRKSIKQTHLELTLKLWKNIPDL